MESNQSFNNENHQKSKNLFCKLDDIELYVFDYMIDLNDDNIVLICKDTNNNYWFCIRRKVNEPNFIITCIDISKLMQFLTNKKSVRETLLNGNEFHEIIVNEDKPNNSNIKLKKSDINKLEVIFADYYINLGKGQLARYD